jgi:hypothetical protein
MCYWASDTGSFSHDPAALETCTKRAREDVPRPFSDELLRIGRGKALLRRAAVTPFLLALTQRFPVEGSRRWQHALLNAVALLALSLILIVVAQVLAGWV